MFGAYLSAPWRETGGRGTTWDKYFGDNDTFVFTMVPTYTKYPWVGHTEEHAGDGNGDGNSDDGAADVGGDAGDVGDSNSNRNRNSNSNNVVSGDDGDVDGVPIADAPSGSGGVGVGVANELSAVGEADPSAVGETEPCTRADAGITDPAGSNSEDSEEMAAKRSTRAPERFMTVSKGIIAVGVRTIMYIEPRGHCWVPPFW